MYTNLSAKNFIKQLPIFVYQTESLENTLNKMMYFCLSTITTIDEKTKIKAVIRKSDIEEHIAKDKTKNIADIITETTSSVIVYPDSDIRDVLSTMKALELNYIPVAKYPWNKLLLGFLDRKHIEEELRTEDCAIL